MTMTLIETKTLGSAAASIAFTSIPQDGTDLVFLASARSAVAATNDIVLVSFNSSTSNFSGIFLDGSGSGTSTGSFARIGGNANGNTSTANTFSNFSLYAPNYSGSSNKSYSVEYVSENNATAAFQLIFAGLWSNTSAISSVTFTTNSASNFAVGSTVSLYKITKGSSGGVVVS
jgi:hypothetical protein